MVCVWWWWGGGGVSVGEGNGMGGGKIGEVVLCERGWMTRGGDGQ